MIEVIREPKVIEELIALSETFELDDSLRKSIDRMSGVADSSDPYLSDALVESEESAVENASCVA